ncbi:hypothetical protein B0H13DRAFT_2319984 [Mycena leptocephala]|nr:hypothetical protein B0H13DRAFT_2319984 [Mycena leptocephala]
MLAVHVRWGDDYEAHCRGPDAPGKNQRKRFLARCWPDQAGVVGKVAEARRDYLVHATPRNATLDVTVAASQDLVLDAEQKGVSMAVDMEIARRAAVFVGNGLFLIDAIHWSALTSNIVYQQLLDKRDPLSIRFT